MMVTPLLLPAYAHMALSILKTTLLLALWRLSFLAFLSDDVHMTTTYHMQPVSSHIRSEC